MASHSNSRPTGGALAAEISTAMVHVLTVYTGRGPTKARTTIGRDHVLVTFHDALTKGERVLARNGHRDDVLKMRRNFQAVMEGEAVKTVEGLTGRTVIGFMSDNHLEPDLGVEVFILEPDGEAEDAPLAEGEAALPEQEKADLAG